MRSGLTLLEVMVALVILTVGLLTAAGAADRAGRALMDARRTEGIVARARATLDSLRGRACDDSNTRGGTLPMTVNGVHLGIQVWRITPGAAGTRFLADTVVVDGAPARRFDLEGAVVCP
ncbi:MAG TPA: prepilin-type N-terminal cleavage/methylation domain-containing protein [Gemmatimonadales bacterium]|nr:prepilin-type N-terminal cleavage/methylation domain-containing protein [Gemmatimonadales bacterium]